MSLRRGCVYGRNEVTGVFTNKKCLAFKAILYAEFQDIWQHSLKYIAETRRKFTKDFAAGCPPGRAPSAPSAVQKKKKRSRKKKRGAPLQLQSTDLRHKIERLKRRRNNNTPKKRRRNQKNIQINIQINM
ncbi:uncharacterized protein LOC119641088 isoform X1 [Glossina fuscipes]|uniref:Uncharacterized protein LOC119641088 isoform X1 n=1 Tax=Glossina fuscipes TaxID=7396 RepID=A0A9C5ZB64_9MUSC|nr:uncharacterized protein LOC119641088 isoform X1 [Glossina fuscipes]